MTQHAADPGKRLAQHLLASEVLELVHGPEEAAKTRAEHQAMRNPNLGSLMQKPSPGAVQADETAAAGPERTVLPRSLVANAPLARVLWHAGLVATKSEGARLVKSGGVYVATGTTEALSFVPVVAQKPEDIQSFTQDGLLVLRLGKWKVRVVEVVDDEVFEQAERQVPGWEEWKVARGGGGS